MERDDESVEKSVARSNVEGTSTFSYNGGI